MIKINPGLSLFFKEVGKHCLLSQEEEQEVGGHSFKMKAYMLLSWAINSYKNLKPEERIRLSFGFNMNF